MSDHGFIEGYIHISKAIDKTNEKLQQIRSGELKPLVTSSKKERDKIGGFFPTDQVTLAARTGMGKTAHVLHWMGDFCNRELNPHYADNLIILYDSWEMPEWRNMLRIYSRDLEVDVKTILDYEQQMQQEMFDRILALKYKFQGYPIYFRNISQTVDGWYKSKKKIRDQHKKATIVNVVDHTRLVSKSTEKSEMELISDFMVAGMKLKLEDDDINIFLSQMNRSIETGAGGRENVGKNLPISSDIFGADAVYQCSDIVIADHRPGFYGLTEWEGIPTGVDKNNPDKNDHLLIECVLKQRDGWTGNITRRHNLALNQIEDYE